MAARCVQAPRRPVTLRDFLELGCDSSSDGFRSYPRRLPLDPDADAALLHQQQQQTPPPAPRPEPAATQLLRRSPSSRSPSSRSLSLFSLPSPGPGALARISSLSRSFSRRIKEGFWRRRDVEGHDDDEDAYFDDRDSCGFPSPLVSSCSASDSDEYEYAAEFEADVTMTTTEETPASERDKATASTSTSSSSSSSSSNSADHDRTDAAAAAADGKKMQGEADGDSAVGRKKLGGSMVEDKQQLSPVSVLDFHFDDDDGEEEGSDAGTCSSPSFQFQRCTPPADLHETKQQAQLLHKIRLYDDGVAQGIDPVDLDARFTAATSESGESADASTRPATTTSSSSTASSSSSADTTPPRHDDDDEAEHQSAAPSPSPSPDHHDQEPDDEYRLLARLLEHDAAAAACLDDEVSRVLILDFFAEGADRLIIRSSAAGAVVGGSRPLDDDRSEALLVGAAAEWLRGAGPRWGIGDVLQSGKAALDDMERSRRWMCVGEEERDVGADVEAAVVDALVDELVAELVLPWWPRGDMMMVVDASELRDTMCSLTEC